MKKIFKIAIYMLVLTLLITGCNSTEKVEDLGGAVASVNGQKINMEDLEKRVQQVAAMYEYPIEGAENKGTVDYLKEQVLESIIDQILVKEKADKDKIEVTQADFDNEMKTITGQFENTEKFQAFLTERKMTQEDFETMVREQLILNKVFGLITAEITAPKTDPEAYYLANLAEFYAPEQRQVSHILLFSQEEVEMALARLEKGANFGTLAAEISVDPTAKDNKGFIDYFTQDDINLVKEFVDGAFAIEKVGVYTKTPVQTIYGLHIIKLEDLKPAKQYSFEEVKDIILNSLIMEAKQSKFKEYTDGLRTQAKIVNNLQKILDLEQAESDKAPAETTTPDSTTKDAATGTTTK